MLIPDLSKFVTVAPSTIRHIAEGLVFWFAIMSIASIAYGRKDMIILFSLLTAFNVVTIMIIDKCCSK